METKATSEHDVLAFGDRRVLTEDILSELTALGPPDFAEMFTAWHRASLRLLDLTVLWALRAHGPQTMGHLAARVDVSVAGLTHVVERMTVLGLVQRRTDSHDRRHVIVDLTDRSLEILTPPAWGRRARLDVLLARLSDDELDSLLVGIRAIAAARACVGDEVVAPVEAPFPEAIASGSHAR